MIGWLLIIAGAVFVVPQVFASTPWQAGVVLGCVLVCAGAIRVLVASSR
jgi:hypothetical protein